MNEKREPGYYAVKVDGNESLAFVTILASGREMVTLLDGADCDETSVVFGERVEQWGPRIIPSTDLVQVPKEELAAVYDDDGVLEWANCAVGSLESVLKHYKQNDDLRHEVEQVSINLSQAVDRLEKIAKARFDSLRRREGESDER